MAASVLNTIRSLLPAIRQLMQPPEPQQRRRIGFHVPEES